MTWAVIYAALAGGVLGRLSAGWAAAVLGDIPAVGLSDCAECGQRPGWIRRWLALWMWRCSHCGKSRRVLWPLAATLGLMVCCAVYAWFLTVANCQDLHEVRPATPMHLLRLPYHLAFLFLLAVATWTDLLDYVIPDEVIWVGVLTAVLGAAISGDLQIIHIWVNWEAEVPGLYGPWLPEWMKHHQHLHGLAWSLAGMTVGATFIWLVRTISGWILGQPAMGFGDVTLMAMIGAFMGWQPSMCVIAIAPATAIVVGLLVRLVTGRSFVAYGPYLALSALIVLCAWRWMWAQPMMLRTVFSHWPSTLGLVGGSLVALVVLLGGLRLFREVPINTIRR